MVTEPEPHAIRAGQGPPSGSCPRHPGPHRHTGVRPARCAPGRATSALDRFLDREISWLDFNARVLELAEDPDLYLLERVNFLSIFASNLDEFFMVRVAGLKRRIATGLAVPPPPASPSEQLEQIKVAAHKLQHRHARIFAEQIRPALAYEHIHIVRWDELDEAARTELSVHVRASRCSRS